MDDLRKYFETTVYHIEVNGPGFKDRFSAIGMEAAKALFADKYREFFKRAGHWVGVANENEDYADDTGYTSGLNEVEVLEFDEVEHNTYVKLVGE